MGFFAPTADAPLICRVRENRKWLDVEAHPGSLITVNIGQSIYAIALLAARDPAFEHNEIDIAAICLVAGVFL